MNFLDFRITNAFASFQLTPGSKGNRFDGEKSVFAQTFDVIHGDSMRLKFIFVLA